MKELTVIERQDQRVLTTRQLAVCYGTTVESIIFNFNSNKDKYIEGVQYFFLKGEALRQFKDYIRNSNVVKPNSRHLYLWTESGALHHAKSLGTEKAWKVFEILEETYFRVKYGKIPTHTKSVSHEDKPMSMEDVLKNTIELIKDIKLQVLKTQEQTYTVKSLGILKARGHLYTKPSKREPIAIFA